MSDLIGTKDKCVEGVFQHSANPKKSMYSFLCLALGTRFKYQGCEKIWVKIGHDLIAEWDNSRQTDRWIAQKICSFGDNELELEIEVRVE